MCRARKPPIEPQPNRPIRTVFISVPFRKSNRVPRICFGTCEKSPCYPDLSDNAQSVKPSWTCGWADYPSTTTVSRFRSMASPRSYRTRGRRSRTIRPVVRPPSAVTCGPTGSVKTSSTPEAHRARPGQRDPSGGRKRLDCYRQARRPGLLEGHAADPSHHINATGRHSHLEDGIGGREIVFGQVKQCGAKALQCPHDAHGVLGRGPHPNVDIAGGARNTVRGERVGADDQKFSAFRGQCGQYVVVVAVQASLQERPTHRASGATSFPSARQGSRGPGRPRADARHFGISGKRGGLEMELGP